MSFIFMIMAVPWLYATGIYNPQVMHHGHCIAQPGSFDHGVLAYRFGQDFPNGPRIAYPCFGASFVSVPFKPAFMSAQVRAAS